MYSDFTLTFEKVDVVSERLSIEQTIKKEAIATNGNNKKMVKIARRNM